jgi:hypothetical protein
MGLGLTQEEQSLLRRVAQEPFYWVRKHVPEVKQWEDEFFDLLDRLKAIWEQSRINRINLCFMLKWELVMPSQGTYTFSDFINLQAKQNSTGSRLIFEIDLKGSIVNEIDTGEEIEPASMTYLSLSRGATIFWLGSDFQILCKGISWNPKNKQEILKDIKSKKRDRLLSMDSYQKVLDTHFDQCIRDEAGGPYWFPGHKNRVLLSTPERIFQQSLFMFLKNEVDCIPELEPMFKDHSRCDIKIFVDNYDIYFIEIKWIGYCAVKKRDAPIISAEAPDEYTIDRAIQGAHQTKIYVEKNNKIEYDSRIRLGVIVVYDGYPVPKSPINYPNDIQNYPLLATIEYPLASTSPSVASKMLAKTNPPKANPPRSQKKTQQKVSPAKVGTAEKPRKPSKSKGAD